jgi:aminoglycoside phosphotransferase (APT) family kinase protein
VCEYLKIHYDNSGAATASRIQQLHAQLQGGTVRVPQSVCYVEDEKLLLQSSLERDVARSLSDTEVATVLARIHGLSVFGLQHDDGNLAGQRQATEDLVSCVFPEQYAHICQTNRMIGHALAAAMSERRVVLHGDAHLGNLFPLRDGAIGVIDVDGMRWGAAIDDLASFYGFLIWISLRDRRPIDHLLAGFPAFIQSYNRSANSAVNETHAFAMLAQKLVVERIRRGITRGKMVDADELFRLLSAAEICLKEAGYRNVC